MIKKWYKKLINIQFSMFWNFSLSIIIHYNFDNKYWANGLLYSGLILVVSTLIHSSFYNITLYNHVGGDVHDFCVYDQIYIQI